MSKTSLKSVDEYIATQPADTQAILERVRSTIRKAVPTAEETISYGMPTYERDGTYIIYFAGWKQHYSLYPATRRLVAALRDELAPYAVNKGTIRFPISEPVPVKLIGHIARFLAEEAAERASEKPGARRGKKRLDRSNPG